MKAKCGHVAEKSYAEAHNGLCRRCHSNFSFLLELEQKYGEDALVEYWYAKILTYRSETKEEIVLLHKSFDRVLSTEIDGSSFEEKLY
jgi:hypothetical protein